MNQSNNANILLDGKWGRLHLFSRKNDELSKENYRPVTVLPALNNVFEKLLASQLDQFYSEILSDYISAYRRHYSCETSLMRLTEDWKSSLDNKQLVAVISMDLSKAFDTIPHGLLLAKLKAYGVNSRSCMLLKDYLHGRMQRVKVGDTSSDWQEVRRGVPQGSVLGPMFFNIFINDLFLQMKTVQLNMYADDGQLYTADTDPISLERRISHEASSANAWYEINGMIANPSKHQGMILGKTDHQFNFSVNDSLELLGITIDKDLSFKQHVSSTCKKVNNQFGVMTRFGKLMSTETMLCLYKAFILPHFYYCSMVWHFSSKQDSDKLDLLNQRILRFIFKDYNSEYNLLKKAGTANLKDKRLQNMILTIFKCLHFADYPRYLKDMFRLRSGTYFLRGHNMLCLPKPLTTSYGINSFSYLAATTWNSLPDHYRTISDFTSFRRLISTGNNNLLKGAGTANLSTSR